MAWNEPGGGKDNDPWGGRGGNQGPPDLDEAFRKLQGQLKGIFGGGSGKGGGKGINASSLGLMLVILAIVYGAWGTYTVDQQERGVVFRFGRMLENVVEPGLHWNAPVIDVVQKVNVTRVATLPHQALMLTQDENIVDVSLNVQYLIEDPKNYATQVKSPETSLAHATESALRHVVGGSLMDAVITEGREVLGQDVKKRLQSYMDRYGTGLSISTVNVDNVGPPKQVQPAFDDVQKAKEDEVRVTNEANAYAESIIPEARGEAQKQIEQANAYRDQVIARAKGDAQRFTQVLGEYQQAKTVTRDRLYLEAIEKVFANSSKVIVDVEGGNNMLYLPLDRMVGGAVGQGVNQQSVENITDAIVREVNSRAANTRRESR